MHYEIEPWTRDGRVKAYVVQVAPDVSGLVTDVPVHDNQDVKAGDVLFEIDRARFQLAYDQAQASVRSQQVAREQRCATPSATARWASWSRRKPWNRARPSCSRPRPRWPRPRCS